MKLWNRGGSSISKDDIKVETAAEVDDGYLMVRMSIRQTEVFLSSLGANISSFGDMELISDLSRRVCEARVRLAKRIKEQLETLD